MCRGNRCKYCSLAVLVFLLGLFVCLGSQALATSIAGDTISAQWLQGSVVTDSWTFLVPQTLSGFYKVTVTDGQLIIEYSNWGWASFTPQWQGPIFTDSTQVPGFTSLSLASMSVAPIAGYTLPVCSWTADTLSINFNPTGKANYWADLSGPPVDEVWTFNFTTAPVPIPATGYLLGSGLLGLVGWRRFRKG